MNESRFDVFTRWAGRPITRRAALGSLGAGLAALAVGGVAAQDASPVATPVTDASPEAGCPVASAAETEALGRRFFDERWTDPDGLAELLADTFVAHRASGVGEFSATEALERYREFQVALPDVQVTVERVVAEQDTVAVLWVAQGTHLGEFDGAPPTGRRAHWEGITIVRVACGQIVEVWTGSDGLGLRQQLGIITDEELLSVMPAEEATPAA